MKKLYSIILLVIFMSQVEAQITITQNDLPSPGDTARYTIAAQNLLLNYNSTGANHNWNFSTLRAASQGLEQYQTTFSTNAIYGIFFLNLPFNSNRATVASNTTELPTSPLLPLTNPYNFYYKSSSQYSQVGFGAEISSIPLPVAFGSKDVIYNLPIQFGNKDTSNSDWNLNVASVGYLGYTQTRTNDVDGWGTLTTPYGTFNVLRVKTTRIQSDTISAAGINLAIPRLEVNEYKWLTTGQKIPVLEVTTQSIFGIEIISEIKFRDDYIRITTNQLSASSYCAGSSISVPYTKYGTFNPTAFLQTGNVFTAQLSDSSGSFANPVIIGTKTTNLSGSINATIPANTISGGHYRIRVVSSNLPVTGSDNGTDITIVNGLPVITAIATADPLQFCSGNSATLSIDNNPDFTYQWNQNGLAIATATQSSYSASAAGSYTVSVTNVCGSVASAAVNIIVDTLPAVDISNSVIAPFCDGDIIPLTSNSTNAVSLQWQLDGSDISGETNASLSVTQSGSYTLTAVNNCGTTISSALSFAFGAAPSIPSVTAAAASICSGDSVLLSGSSPDATSYQWQSNGVDIPNAVDSMLFVSQAGTYTLTAVNSCGSKVSNDQLITINNPPAINSVTSSASALCVGDSLLLTGSSSDATSLQWQFNGADITGATDSMLYINLAGDYVLIATNACSSVTSSLLSVSVNIPVTPIISSSNGVLTSTAAVSYQWLQGIVPLTGATNQNYSPTASGVYSVITTDANGCTSVSIEFNFVMSGINSHEKGNVKIYPNPVNGNFITLEWNSVERISNISIENMIGQQFRIDTDLTSGKILIPVSGLEAGVYNINCKSSNGTSKFLFVKQ